MDANKPKRGAMNKETRSQSRATLKSVIIDASPADSSGAPGKARTAPSWL